MRTTHQYLDKYPVDPDSEKLIVGTIHPHDHEKFIIPFFYGNVISLWSILSDAFPAELKKPVTLENVLHFLKHRRISMSDTILVCDRKKPTASDEDLNPVVLNTNILKQIRHSQINEIFFTSSFGKNAAFRLFYEKIAGLTITPQIKQDRKVVLDKSIFGRPVTLTILYSPSGASNIGLSKTKLYQESKELLLQSARPVYDFKVQYYRTMFGKNKGNR
jgi:G:T/U-mismatch repair DNA glycosylase